MDTIKFGLEPRDREHSEEMAQSGSPPDTLCVILAAVLLLISSMLMVGLFANLSRTNVAGPVASLEPFNMADEFDERVPRGWQ